MNTTLEIQRALRARGFDPGPADGAIGPLTRGAIAAFEAANGMKRDGSLGPELLTKLGLAAAGQATIWIPWFDEAKRLVGRDERRNRSEIGGWSSELELGRFDATATPWCGLFVGHCLAVGMPDEPQPTNPFGARNWLSFGVACAPAPGAILVFRRGSKAGWSGHVGFYAGEDAAAFHVLGGNQSDAVTIARVARTRLLGMRWPKGAPRPAAATVAAAARGALSTNEA